MLRRRVEYEASFELLCGCDGGPPRLRLRQRGAGSSGEPVVKAESPAVTVYNQGVDFMKASCSLHKLKASSSRR